MQRYNIFNQLHKGLEALLSDTVRMLRQTDFSVPGEAHSTINRVNRFLRLFTDQAYLEDLHLLPVIESAAPATAFVLEQDHLDNRVVVQRVKGVLAVYDRAASPEEKQFTGKMLIHAFTEFMILALRHLSKEEDMVNSILWGHYTDEYIVGLEQDMMAYIPPEDLSVYNFWTTRHLGSMQLNGWLVRLEALNDRDTFHEIAALADHELALARVQKTKELFAESAMVA